jgi:hypothetical protein
MNEAPPTLDYSSPPPSPPVIGPPSRYGRWAILLISLNAFGGIILAGIGLFHLPDQTDLGWLMIASGVAAVVCTLRYLGRESPAWARAWAFSTISVVCLSVVWMLAMQRVANLSEEQWRHYEQVKLNRRYAAQTDVINALAAKDTASIGMPIAVALWGWLTWRALRAAR